VLKSPITNFAEILPVEDALIHTQKYGDGDGRRDTRKLIGAIRDYANAPEISGHQHYLVSRVYRWNSPATVPFKMKPIIILLCSIIYLFILTNLVCKFSFRVAFTSVVLSIFFLKTLTKKTGNVCTDITSRRVRAERQLVLHILSVPLWPYLSSIQCSCNTLYCPLWPVQLYHIFPHFRKTVMKHKMYFLIRVQICLK
jgi:hypothetical protein